MPSEERETEIRRRLAMPYHRLISAEPVEGYLGEVLELPGCLTACDTPQEALANLHDAMAGWLESCLMDELPIPEPGSVEMYRPSAEALALYDLASYVFSVVSPRFHRDGSIGAFDFFCIVIWKANRAKSRIAQRLLGKGDANLEAAARRLTGHLTAATTDSARLVYLLEDWGFRLPMASAILTVLQPDRFTVYDTRACGELKLIDEDFEHFERLGSGSNPDKVASGYLSFRDAVARSGSPELSLRDKDKVLWGQSFRRQLEADIERGFGTGEINDA